MSFNSAVAQKKTSAWYVKTSIWVGIIVFNKILYSKNTKYAKKYAKYIQICKNVAKYVKICKNAKNNMQIFKFFQADNRFQIS